MRTVIAGAIMLFCALLGWAQAQEGDRSNDAYQGALKAYLEGDFDRAILMDTHALQADPKNRKAADLLNVLVQERESNRKTEIWIGSQSAAHPVPALVPPLPLAQSTAQRARPSSHPPSHTKGSPKSIAPAKGPDGGELEARVETLLLLMGRNASDQYQELTTAQVETLKKVEENQGQIQSLEEEVTRRMEGADSRLSWMTWFQWLVLIVALSALAMAYRARLDVRRLRLLLEGTPHIGGEKGNVLPLDGTFKH